jgi:HPt (histidine-containing phosphotransfer) domain-containing protein
VEELVTGYLKHSSPELLSNIQQAIEGNNPELLEEAAHRLKGASGAIGAKQVYMAASVLEQMGGEQGLSGVHEALQSLEQRLDILEKYVNKNIGRYISHSS